MAERIKFRIGKEDQWGNIITANPCLNCGNTKIFVWDCGYSSFNPGGACCTKCKKHYQVNDCSSIKGLQRVWNKANPDISVKLKTIDESIEKLKNEKKRLKKLFKVKLKC